MRTTSPSSWTSASWPHRETLNYVGDLKDELRGGARSLITAAIGAGVASFATWVKTRPLKRAIERRRARKAQREAKP